MPPPHFPTLWLAGNLGGNTRAEGASALAAILNETKVTHLSLVRNEIGDEGASALVAILKETKITNLGLKNNNLNYEAKQAVKDAAGSGISITC